MNKSQSQSSFSQFSPDSDGMDVGNPITNRDFGKVLNGSHKSPAKRPTLSGKN